MNLTIDAKTFAAAVAWAAKSLPHRPSVPVLAGLLLEVDDTALTLSAFDYDTSARVVVSADVTEPGRVLLPGRVLAEIANALPGKPVEISLSGADLNLRCGGTEFSLVTMPVDDYPTLPAMPGKTGTVNAEVFKVAVGQVAAAAGKDDTLPMLSCVRVEIEGDTITLAATDRYRIAARPLPWMPASADQPEGALIPARILHDISKGFTGSAVDVAIGAGLAGFTSGDRSTTVRLIDEKFIDYKSRLVTDTWTIWAEADVHPLIDAVKRVALVADKTSPLRLTFTQGQVVVRAGNADGGRGAETLKADLTGEDIEIAFSPAYLIDGLTGIEGDRVRIGMVGPAKPALIVETGEDQDYRYLVMALRVS